MGRVSKEVQERIKSLVDGSFVPYLEASKAEQAAYVAGVRACSAYIIGMSVELERDMIPMGGLHQTLTEAVGKMVRNLVLSADVLIPAHFEE